MERIQKALEKARLMREQPHLPNTTGAPRTVAWRRVQRPSDSVTAPDYTQTRVVPVEKAVLERNRLVAAIPDHPLADVFRVLRTRLLHRMAKDGLRSLAITSATPGAGKSVVAANLALSLAAEESRTVLLVDMDLRQPSVHTCFDLSPQNGLSDFLQGRAALQELFISPGIERLVILPAGRPVAQSSELLSTRRMAQLMEEITHRYADRIVIFDMPPLLGLDDVLVLSPEIHACVLVVPENGNTQEEIRQAMQLLPEQGFMGVVFNKASDGVRSY